MVIVMKKTLLLGACFPSIYPFALPAESRFTKHTKVKLSHSAWRMSVKTQLTFTLALQQLGRGTHTDPAQPHCFSITL